MKKEKEVKALFSQRLCAYIIDIVLVTMLTMFVTNFMPVSDATAKLYKEQDKILEHYTSQTLDVKGMETSINQLVDISYDISRETGVISIISIGIALLYFVVYPAYHDGQSVGKQLLKIKIKKTTGKPLTMNDLLFRAMILYSILVNIILIFLVFFTSKDFYLSSNTILTTIQYIILIVSAFLVAFSKKGQGLHDKLVHTEVVCINAIKEEERAVCEN